MDANIFSPKIIKIVSMASTSKKNSSVPIFKMSTNTYSCPVAFYLWEDDKVE